MPVHRYIPNSVPEIKREMLKEIGVKNAEEIFTVIPERIRRKRRLRLPHSSPEHEVKKGIETILLRNKTCNEVTSFLGAGCWPHYVPAVCDEVNSRSEFLTAYTGEVYSDLGRYQALFEFQSMIGDLVAMDAVSFPLYDWATAVSDACRMALIITGRHEILVPRTMSPERLSVVRTCCGDSAIIKQVDYSAGSGQLDLEDLRKKISSKTAAVYVENPSYLGFIETAGDDVSDMAHKHGALSIVGVEPLSLGMLTPPGEYGADIVCGEGQPLGMHMSFGGALLGFLAFHDDLKFVSATGHRLVSLAATKREGEFGFAYVLPERTMFAAREKTATITGTASVLWAITAAVYMSLLGPSGLRKLAQVIMQRCYYAAKLLSCIKGLKAPIFSSPHFEEFTVNFGNRKVHDVNSALLKQGIQGGKDLSYEFPELGNSALYCVTEVHAKEDIERLATILDGVVE
jgi:glycine dehydrogenase subunit 1